MKKIILAITVCFIFISLNGIAQKGKGGHHHGGKGGGHPHNKRVVVRRSIYRPAKVIVYHPHWGRSRAFNHRWVYFPRHNFYWDNWREMYVYRNGTVWVSNATAPPIIINVNLENEKNYELKEDNDDNDSVQDLNEKHQIEYKPE